MSRKKGQVFSAEQKTKIVLELLKEDQTIAQLASKYQITTKSIQNWKKQFLENAAIAFEPARAVSEFKNEINELKKENDALARALGKTTVERDWAVGKLESLDLSNKKDLVDSKLSTVSMTRQCEMIGISRSSLYYKPKPMSEYELMLLHRIDEIYTLNPEYGYRFIHRQLLEDGITVGREKVLSSMRLLSISAIYPHKKKLTSIKHPQHHIYEYLLKEYWVPRGRTKQIHVNNPNEVWSGDITYIRMNGGFMYLAAVIDWHTKAILAYKISNSMDASLATDVLKDALAKYPKPKIFNSDQGSQYTSHEHTQILKESDIAISMNGKGRSIDNIAIERFFRTLKYSCIYISNFTTIEELKNGIKDYMHKYNFQRFHSSIGYQKPMNVYLEYVKSVA
ncbi:MAG: putative transposase [Campylobacterota bacterium]|nr:putative transposase [Campylobacterota bacterium]MDQ1340022.1 putative transposase [Campylobacterota bacterium]